MDPQRFPFLLIDTNTDDADWLSAELFELGAQGVEERDQTTLVKSRHAEVITLSASFADHASAEAAREAMAAIEAARDAEIVEIIGDGWRDAWKEHFRPFVLSQSDSVAIAVRPPWIEEAEAAAALGAEGPVRWLELEPGRAFGTGLHETTQLVAEALGRLPLVGQPVLDVGCGSGILALTALALGAAEVRGLDNDPEAVEVSNENTTRNALRADFSTADITEEAAERWPFVLANIETHILVPMAGALTRTLSPGGQLLLSGILKIHEDRIHAAYAPLGLRHVGTTARGEWVLVHFERTT